jgi:hypothetical protein
MSSTPDPTEEVKVTNSTSAPIVVLLPTVSSQTQDANATVVYGQQQEVLKAIDGSTSIPAGGTKTFVLDQTYVDPTTGQSEYSTIYDLLPSTASWYSPVANLGVIQSFDVPPSYPAQTVTAASADAFANAALFVQTIDAYPTSALATSYQQAINQSSTNASSQANGSSNSSDNVAQSISGTVDAFFKGTKSFQNVTLAAVVAVQSYYASFPFVWAQYATTKTTYYLYSSSGSTTSFVGTLSITPPASLNVALANGGCTCTFTPASNGSDTTNVNVDTAGAKSLTYTNSLFVDNVNSDIPQIAVKGTFQIKSLFTGKSADTQIIPVLTGTVNGTTCIGFDSPQLSTDTSSSYWDTLFHPQNAQQIVASIMTIGGFVMMLAFAGQMLYGAYKFFRGLGAAKQPTTEELLNEKLEAFRADQQKNFDELFKKMTAAKETPPTTADEAATGLKEQTDIVSDNVSAGKLETGLKAQADSLSKVAEFEPEMNSSQLTTLEGAAGKLRSSMTALEQAPTTDLGPTVSAQTTQLQSVTGEITTLQTELGSSIGTTTKAELAQNAELSAQVTEEVETADKAQESIEGEDDPEAGDGIMPEGEVLAP